MMDFQGWTQVSAGPAGALVGAIWQGLCVTGVFAVLLRLLPGLTAAARSVVWAGVMVLVFALPFVQPGRGGGTVPNGAQIHVGAGFSVVLLAAWVLLSAFRMVQLGRSALYLRGVSRRATEVAADEAVLELLAGDRRVALCASEEVDRPSVAGFFRPRILMPSGMLERLTAGELQQIVLHEMEHLRRGDDWTNLLQKLAIAVFPLNPALLWIERELCLERELACDDKVLRATGARKAYAACLAHLAEQTLVRRGVSLALGAWERRPELVRRVHRILRGGGQGSMGTRQAGAVVTVLLLGAGFAGDGLMHVPQLVSFAPATQMAAGMEPSSGVGHPGAISALPVRFVEGAGVDGSGALQTPHPHEGLRAGNRQRAARRLRLQQISTRVPLPRPSEEMVVLMTWPMVPVSTGQGLTVRRSQVSYAAVPTRDGWLFVQL